MRRVWHLASGRGGCCCRRAQGEGEERGVLLLLHAGVVLSSRRSRRAARPPPPLRVFASSSSLGAARAVPITVLTVGKGNSEGAALMAGEWGGKLRRYAPLTEAVVKPNPRGAKDVAVAVRDEGERVLKALAAQPPGAHVVLLDERGRELTSEQLAALLRRAGDAGWPALCFVLGGPFGHAASVKERADDSVRLSKMVLNHQVAHVVLLEQLYRAWTILRGEPYHH